MPVPPDQAALYAQQQMYPQLASQVHVEPQHLFYNGLIVPNPRAPPLPFGASKAEGYDPSQDAAVIYKALKGFNVDENALIKTLPKIGILKMDALADYYLSHHGQQLVEHLDRKKGGDFGKALHAIVVGPLAYDVELLDLTSALSSPGTKEAIFTELIMDRSSDDLYRLSVEYKYKYGTDLSMRIKKDLKGSTERRDFIVFLLALNVRRPPDNLPVDDAQVRKDVDALYHAGESRKGTDVDEMVFFKILLSRSRPHLSAVVQGYGQTYRSLTKVIKKEFTGHTGDALKYIIESVKPKRDGRGIWRDAKLIHKTMKGAGTNDTALIYRLVRAHWKPERMAAILTAYRDHNTKRETLEERVKKETSGDYEKLLLAIIEAEQH
ncbi:hypothetical protein H0H87_007220 [Tephrocybe sp. NHM501043]|nr:hypothetical protein H0H87_007220 [Tephrocybe sp. NHM501043]